MNPQTQNQQPDYNFILNQPGNNTPKKPPKLLIMLGGVLCSVIIGMIIVFLFVEPRNNVRQASQQPADSEEAAVLVKQYFEYVQADELEAAYGLLSERVQAGSDTRLFSELIPGIFANIDIPGCVHKGSSGTPAGLQELYYECPTQNKQFTAATVVLITKENQVHKIDDFIIRAQPYRETI